MNSTVVKQSIPQRSPARASGHRASKALLSAAVGGLLGVNLAACSDDEKDDKSSEGDAASSCDAMIEEAVDAALAEANNDCDPPASSAAMECPEVTDGSGAAIEEELEKETSYTEVQHTFAELTALCDEQEGYVQVHASCGGVNTCQGFSYGDWGQDAVLSEHTCSGANSCKGLSCIIPGPGEERSGEEVYTMDEDGYVAAGVGLYDGPVPCSNCHMDSNDDGPIFNTFKVFVLPGSERTLDNWLERPQAEQEHIVTFGSQGITAEGIGYSHMASYAKVFSKAEISAAVEHIRTKTTPMLEEIKMQDPEGS